MAESKVLVIQSGVVKQLPDADELLVGVGIDRSSAGVLVIGDSVATSVEIGSTGELTTIKGNCRIDEATGIGETGTIDGILHLYNGTSDTDFVIEKNADTQARLVYHNAGSEAANTSLDASENLVIENDVPDQDIVFKINDGGIDIEMMRIDGDVRRIGILTSSPITDFHIAGAGSLRLDDDNSSSNADATPQGQFYRSGTWLGTLGFTSAEDVNMDLRNVLGGNIEIWTSNLQRLTVDPDGDVGIDVIFPLEKLHVADAIAISNSDENGTARLTTRTSRAPHGLSLAPSSDTSLAIPEGVRLLGVQFNVDTAVTDDAGDDTWNAALITGSSTTLVTNAAAAVNTKVDKMLLDEITTAVTEIRFTPNAGSFTAGKIEVVVYFEQFTSLSDV